MSRFGFELPRQGSPWPFLVSGVSFVGLGVSELTAHHDHAVSGAAFLVFAVFLTLGVVQLGLAAFRFVDRRNNPDPPDSDVGREWTASDGKRLTIEGVDGDIVRASRYDPLTGMADAWVGSWDRFQELVGLGEVASHEPPRAQRA